MKRPFFLHSTPIAHVRLHLNLCDSSERAIAKRGDQNVSLSPGRKNSFQRIVGYLSQLCGVVSALLILAAIVITCQMLYVRFWLGLSTTWQTEGVTFMMIAATMVGLPYVQFLRGHVNVDLIPLMLPRAIRRVLALVVLLATIAVGSVMLWYGVEMTHVAYERNWRTDTIWGPLQWPIYMTLPFGFAVFLLQVIADLIAVVTGEEEPFAAAHQHSPAHEEVG